MAKLTNDQAADRIKTIVVEEWRRGELTDKEYLQLDKWIDRAWERGRDK